MAEPEDMVVPLLREMREEMRQGFGDVAARLERLEAAQTSFRHALSADSLFSKLVTGEFEERIELLERRIKTMESLELRVKELETHK